MKTMLTITEYETCKVYELNNSLYNAIEAAFVKRLGERLGKKILTKYMEKTVRELSCQSYVDIVSLIKFI